MSLGRPQVSDLTDHLSRYFKGSRRRSGESVNDYTSPQVRDIPQGSTSSAEGESLAEAHAKAELELYTMDPHVEQEDEL